MNYSDLNDISLEEDILLPETVLILFKIYSLFYSKIFL